MREVCNQSQKILELMRQFTLIELPDANHPFFLSYLRLLSSLPKFVRGCDHVVKFFQGSKPRSRKNSETKKSKGTLTTEGPCDRGKSKDFETPHKIAEAVREQSLGEKDNSKKKTAEKWKAKKQSQIIMSGARLSPGKKNIVDIESFRLEPDENGNEVKALPRGNFFKHYFTFYFKAL